MKTNTEKKTKSGLLNRPEPVSKRLLPQIDFALRRVNRALPTEKVLALMKDEAQAFFESAEVVGRWVWIKFDDKQPQAVTRSLAELGFNWNQKRQTWQHPCGEFPRHRATYDPRKRYGVSYPAKFKGQTATKFATSATGNATKSVVTS
jgi:hypothetical protein